MNETFWKFIGLLAACLTMFSFVPQVVKMYRTKASKDVSLFTLVQLTCGVVFWFLYGLHKKDEILIISNLVTFSTLLAALILYFKYIKRDAQLNKSK